MDATIMPSSDWKNSSRPLPDHLDTPQSATRPLRAYLPCRSRRPDRKPLDVVGSIPAPASSIGLVAGNGFEDEARGSRVGVRHQHRSGDRDEPMIRRP